MDNASGPAILYHPIGTIHSPFTDISGMPIQPNGARGVQGTIDLEPGLCGGLAELDGFSRIILLYALHRCTGYSLKVTPLLDIKPYVPAFDSYPDERSGWLEPVAHNAHHTRSDNRFR